ncbi:MAG TPA: tyrosine-type recombinase/integrase, partial [Ardenticatenaceae bacterium]|nr:tyrosine-type recombinase/integrase [Ardenticatenaceae bacterium]
IINELLQAAGIEYPITPHILRHTFATRALEVTGDLAVVQDLLGHAEPTTTRIYAKVRSKRLHEAHRQIFEYDSDAADES